MRVKTNNLPGCSGRPYFKSIVFASTLFCTSHALAASPFTYAAYGPPLNNAPPVSLVDAQSTSGSVFSWGLDGEKARASYGDNGVALSSLGYAVSAWSDGFMVTGGNGVGTLNFSVQLHGTLFDQDAAYVLLMSDDPNAFSPAAIVADAVGVYNQIPGTTPVLQVLVTGAHIDYLEPEIHQLVGGPVNSLFNVSVPFTYGQTVYLASVLDITGPGDFYNSAFFGVTAPEGASITSLSGTLYSAAAVPEAETYSMMLAGLALVGFMARSRKQVEA